MAGMEKLFALRQQNSRLLTYGKNKKGGGGISLDLKFVVAYFCSTFFLGYQHTSLT
jgi:hypothetical protein